MEDVIVNLHKETRPPPPTEERVASRTLRLAKPLLAELGTPAEGIWLSRGRIDFRNARPELLRFILSTPLIFYSFNRELSRNGYTCFIRWWISKEVGQNHSEPEHNTLHFFLNRKRLNILIKIFTTLNVTLNWLRNLVHRQIERRFQTDQVTISKIVC